MRSAMRKCWARTWASQCLPLGPGVSVFRERVSRVAMPISVMRLWFCSSASMSRERIMGSRSGRWGKDWV